MSDAINVAPGGGEGASAPIAVITPAADTGENLSISQAARALAAARHKPKEQEAAAPAQVEQAPQELPDEGNAAPPEAEAPSEEISEAEPAEALPPIEPPRSWTKEAKDRWESLPRETQEYLAQREQERDREVRQSQNKSAEERKAIEAERQKAEQVRQQYEAALPSLMQTLQDVQAGQFSDIRTMADVEKLVAEDPLRYLQWQAHQQKVQAVQQELEKAEARKHHESENKRQEFIKSEYDRLVERIPDLADPVKAQETTNKVVSRLKDIGFTDGELAELSKSDFIHDHRIQLLLIDGVKYAEVQKAKQTVVAKPVPAVQRPGTARPQGAAAAENIQALTAKLERTGSLKDAQALRAAQAKTRRA
jgi:hypothetical protein